MAEVSCNEGWGLFSNFENTDVDAAYVLTHTSTRTTLINQIMSAAFNYELDGVNIDFENITEAAYGDSYIEFIRELAIKCHNNGISLSVDVTVPASFRVRASPRFPEFQFAGLRYLKNTLQIFRSAHILGLTG